MPSVSTQQQGLLLLLPSPWLPTLLHSHLAMNWASDPASHKNTPLFMPLTPSKMPVGVSVTCSSSSSSPSTHMSAAPGGLAPPLPEPLKRSHQLGTVGGAALWVGFGILSVTAIGMFGESGSEGAGIINPYSKLWSRRWWGKEVSVLGGKGVERDEACQSGRRGGGRGR